MTKKVSIKERILGSKKARGLIIAGILACIWAFLGYIYISSGEGIYGAVLFGILGALAATFGLVIKETFDIKESWKLGLLVIGTGLFIAFVLIR